MTKTLQNSTCETVLEDGRLSVQVRLDEFVGVEQLKGLLVRYGWDGGLKKATEAVLGGMEEKVQEEIQKTLHREIIKGALVFDKVAP